MNEYSFRLSKRKNCIPSWLDSKTRVEKKIKPGKIKKTSITKMKKKEYE
jgi:hypothetical protein